MCVSCFCQSFSHSWPFAGLLGQVSCKIAYVARDVCKFASIFTLALLSVDRCLASYHSLAALRTICVGKITICVIWIACALIATPYFIYAGIRDLPSTQNSTSCQLPWSSQLSITWVAFQFLVGFILPSTVILAAYAVLFRHLRRIKSRRHGRVTRMMTRQNRRMLHTVIVVVVAFVVCQAPYYTLQWVAVAKQHDFAAHHQQGARFGPPTISLLYVLVVANMFSQILVFVSSCCNPIIYGLLNENYRTSRRHCFFVFTLLYKK